MNKVLLGRERMIFQNLETWLAVCEAGWGSITDVKACLMLPKLQEFRKQ